jgi:3-dehydrosphinganine reductase
MSAFRGKKVAISGGSSGIGKAAAIELARGGASVAILARTRSTLDEALAEIRAAGGPDQRFVAVSVDVTSDEGVEAAAREVLEGLGGLDVLVANSGYAKCAPVGEASLEDFRAIFDTNLLGHVRLVKAFLPHFKAQRSGEVALVTSMLGFMSFYGYGAYSASKFAIVGFAEALRQELVPFNVHVTVFYPPTTDTPGLEKENQDKPALTWAIEGNSRKFTSEQVATAMLRGIEKRWFTNMVGADSWFVYYASRYAPWLVRWIIDRDLWSHVKKAGLPS